MKSLYTLIICIISFSVNAQATFNYKKDFKKIQIKSQKGFDDFYYEKLFKRYNRNDSTLSNQEMLALLIGYTARPEFKPYENVFKSKDNKPADNLNVRDEINKALTINKSNPFELENILKLGYLYMTNSQEDSAKYYVFRAKKIFKAMRFSGDGKTKETPMFSLGPYDGKYFVESFLGKNVFLRGSTYDSSNQLLEIVKTDSTEAGNFYFIIDHARQISFKIKQQ